MRRAPSILAVAILAGCAREPEQGWLTTAQLDVLRGASRAWLDGRATSETQARRDAGDAVSQAPGVAASAFAQDGFSLGVRFDGGRFGGIDTVNGFADGSAPDLTAVRDALAQAWGLSALTSPAPSPPPPPGSKGSPSSHRVLLMATSTEQTGGLDVATLQELAADLKENACFDEGDIEIRANAAEGGYRDLEPSDLTDLEDYGLVLLHGHATSHCPDDDQDVYGFGFKAVPEDCDVQVQFAATPPFGAGPWAERDWERPLLDDGSVTVWDQPNERLDTSGTTYALSEAYLAEHLRLADDAIVVLSAPNGWAAADTFLDAGAGAFVSWEGEPSALQSEAGLYFPFFLAARGDDAVTHAQEASWSQEEGGATLRGVNGASGGMALPTWMDVATTDWPDGTVSVRTTLSYTDGSLPPPEPASFEDVPHSPNTFSGLVPSAEVEIRVEALNAEGEVIGDRTQTQVLEPGGCNDVTLPMQSLEITAVVSPGAVALSSTYGASVVASLWRLVGEDDWEVVVGAELQFDTTLGRFQDATHPSGARTVVTSDSAGEARARLLPDGREGTALVTIQQVDGEATLTREVRFVTGEYFEDFDGDVGIEWSSVATGAALGHTYLGPFTTQEVTLTLTDLPAHSVLEVEYDLVLTGTWQGVHLWFREQSADHPDGWHSAFASPSTLIDVVEHDEVRVTNHYGPGSTLTWYADGQAYEPGDPPHAWGIDNVRVTVTD